jgi:DNA-binding NarL/FixJ family response regulator
MCIYRPVPLVPLDFLTVHRLRRDLPGIDVIEAEHATSALEILARSTVDLVLTDNGIGPKDGLTMIRELRRQHFAPPIVMASMNRLLAQRALVAGASAFVYCGDSDEIVRAVRACLPTGRST